MPPLVLVRSEHPEGDWAVRCLRRLALDYLEALRLPEAELSVVVTTDPRIRSLNRVFREHDRATDVLSFPAAPQPKVRGRSRPLGDVVISLDTARRRAREDRRWQKAELARYLAHGLLHLLGHDHHAPDEAAKMARAEEQLLGSAGMVSGPSDD